MIIQNLLFVLHYKRVCVFMECADSSAPFKKRRPILMKPLAIRLGCQKTTAEPLVMRTPKLAL
jgi:hypothetical protein